MPEMFESQEVGKRQSLADLIALIEVQGCPYTSMANKRERPKQKLHQWQAKSYPITGHAGVPDGDDAKNFQSNPRGLLQCVAQKTWYLPGVSDFAEETEVAGLKKGEMAEQVADALVSVKRQIEKRCLSNIDTQMEGNNGAAANETRGIFTWLATAAQTNFPVPTGFLTPAASTYSGNLSAFQEATFIGMTASSFIQRKGPIKMDAFLGIYLKGAFTNFSKYVDNINDKTPVRRFDQSEDTKALIHVIDRLVMDTGEVDLHVSPFLLTPSATGADSTNTHSSGVVVDMDMCGLAYTRMPRVVQLPYQGGGYKAIVDAIFLHMYDNPLGGMTITCTTGS
jgi:hypothetical protein